MPFPTQLPRVYTKSDIEAITPGQMGVYGIFRQGQWVYVGSGDVRDRMLAHVNGDNACINGERATHWVSEITSNFTAREEALIIELAPTCNKKVG